MRNNLGIKTRMAVNMPRANTVCKYAYSACHPSPYFCVLPSKLRTKGNVSLLCTRSNHKWLESCSHAGEVPGSNPALATINFSHNAKTSGRTAVRRFSPVQWRGQSSAFNKLSVLVFPVQPVNRSGF
jgi:hypothetical protein